MTTKISLTEEQIDHICWMLVSDIDNFRPVKEKAEQCMEGVEEIYEENDNMDWDEGFSWEIGYHAGASSEAEAIADKLQALGIDVYKRAEEYRQKVNREEVPDDREGLPEFDFEDKRYAHLGSGNWYSESELTPDSITNKAVQRRLEEE